MDKKRMDNILTRYTSYLFKIMGFISLNFIHNWFDKKFTPTWSRRKKIIVYGILLFTGIQILKHLSNLN